VERLAAELGGVAVRGDVSDADGLRMNCVMPGFIDSIARQAVRRTGNQ